MTSWHAFFDEDAYSRGFIFLQKGDDESTAELFDTVSSEQVEASGFDAQLVRMMSVANNEAARRNAYEDRREISAALARKIADQSGI